ncbi:hypothetical protein AGMMS50276_26930 [Synergistales bacterium]|nr:hypothetical protein AGMMS50276_26930 [Synergistales bacterium]
MKSVAFEREFNRELKEYFGASSVGRSDKNSAIEKESLKESLIEEISQQGSERQDYAAFFETSLDSCYRVIIVSDSGTYLRTYLRDPNIRKVKNRKSNSLPSQYYRKEGWGSWFYLIEENGVPDTSDKDSYFRFFAKQLLDFVADKPKGGR